MEMSDEAADDWHEYSGPEGGEGWIHEPSGFVDYSANGKPSYDPRSRDNELSGAEKRRQIVVLDVVHEYIRRRSRETDMTISQYMLSEVLPDDWDAVVHGFSDGDTARLKVTPSVDEAVDSMAGQKVHKGEVVALYALVDALSVDGEEATAEEMISIVPEQLSRELDLDK